MVSFSAKLDHQTASASQRLWQVGSGKHYHFLLDAASPELKQCQSCLKVCLFENAALRLQNLPVAKKEPRRGEVLSLGPAAISSR